MIPGLSSVIAGIGGGFRFIGISTAKGTSGVCSLPVGCLPGDIAVFFDGAFDGGGGTISSAIPAGWTTITAHFVDYGSDSTRANTSRKVLTAGDISAGSVTGLSTANTMNSSVKFLIVFRAISGYSAISNNTWTSSSSTTRPGRSQDVVPGAEAQPIVVFGFLYSRYSNTTIASSNSYDATYTMFDDIGGQISGGLLAYKIYNSGPVTHNLSSNDSDVMVTGYIRMIP